MNEMSRVPIPRRAPSGVALPTVATSTSTSSRMTLASTTRGVQDEPLCVLVYGVEGVGKSSFCAGAPKPIFVFANNGTAELDVARFPRATSWQDILDAVDALRTEPHEYETLVIDELDWIEGLCWKHICARDGKESIEAYGFGKGYLAALEEWRVLLARLNTLRFERKMNVFMTAHSIIRTFKTPGLEGDYDRYQLKIHDKVGGVLKEWAKAVLFAEWETATKAANDDSRDKRKVGIATGRRVLQTQRTAAYDAKNRLGIPETIDLSWSAFSAAVKRGHGLRVALAECQRNTSEASRAQVTKYLDDNGYKAEAYEAAIAGLTTKEVSK